MTEAQIKQWRKLRRPHEEPDPEAPGAYQREIYSALRAPIFSTKPTEWEALARSKLPAPNFGYVQGAAGMGRTAAANTAAFDRYRLRPRMLVDATRRDLSVELFGVRYPSPLLAGPVGVQSIMHPDGEEATARACAELDIPMVLSTAATRTIEQVAAANGSGKSRWYQLYWPKPQCEEVTASLLERAKQEGYSVLVVTLDTFNLAWRPTDLDTAYLPFIWGEGCQIMSGDPAFDRYFTEQKAEEDAQRPLREKLAELWSLLTRSGNPATALQALWHLRGLIRSRAVLDVLNSATYRQWSDLATLRRLWGADRPIVLKGIQTIEDAHLAIEHGMDGIVVSNHGGRQLDGAIASLDALAAIGADERVRRAGLTVLFDSGIRTGSDALKALSLGAHAVLLGRPYMYGLAIAGQAGVAHVLRCLLAELDIALGNMGKTSVRDLSSHDLEIWAKAAL